MRVMVECYHDTALVRALGVPMRSLGHEHGKGNVLMALAKWNGAAIGMVDADPGKQNSIPGEMAKYRDRESAHGLTLMGHAADARKFLVVVGPTLEDWRVARAQAAGIRLSDYGLPDSARALHRIPRYDMRPRFHAFLADLASDNGMGTLRKWLTSQRAD